MRIPTKDGRANKEPCLTIRLSESLHDDVQRAAEWLKMSPRGFCKQAVINELARRRKAGTI